MIEKPVGVCGKLKVFAKFAKRGNFFGFLCQIRATVPGKEEGRGGRAENWAKRGMWVRGGWV